MDKAGDYRKHAEDCRTLARKAKYEHERNQLLMIADTWLALASDQRDAEKRRDVSESCNK